MQGRYAYGDTRCSCIAASAVTGLNTEPGGYVAWSARFSEGKFLAGPVFGVSPWLASEAFVTWPAYTDGLYVGDEAIARTEPSRGSIATIAPPRAAHSWFDCASWIPYASAFSAACWSLTSIVSRTEFPGVGRSVGWTRLRGRPSESRYMRSSPLTPRR